jgi:hypothetical protein
MYGVYVNAPAQQPRLGCACNQIQAAVPKGASTQWLGMLTRSASQLLCCTAAKQHAANKGKPPR